MAVTGFLSVCCFLALLTRLVHLQVAERPAYAARAEANRWRVVPVEAARGRILDRAGRVLADSRSAWRIRLDRRVPTGERAALLERLARSSGCRPPTCAPGSADPAADPVVPATLLDDAPDDVVLALRERQAEWAGVEIDSHPIRRYPHGSLAAHVLGTLGAAAGPGRAGRRGASGVEMAHDEALAGRAGETRIEVDSAGRPVRTVAGPGGHPRPGSSGSPSISTCRRRRNRPWPTAWRRPAAGRTGAFGLAAPGGSVVALDLRDGSVLALASAPTFEPAALAGRIPAQTWAALHDPAAHAPLTNRALQGLYAPGSTFKPVTALAALGAGLITPATVVDDRGTYRLGSRSLQNAQGRAHGKVDLARAMAVSSDVYFYGLGDRLYSGPAATAADGPIQAVAARLGFGRPTGIDIGPEASGRVPGPSDRRAAHARRPAAVPDGGWYPGDNVNLSIGQGDMLVTPLQLAGAYATLATGLVPPTPHVLADAPVAWRPAVGGARPGGAPGGAGRAAPGRRHPGGHGGGRLRRVPARPGTGRRQDRDRPGERQGRHLAVRRRAPANDPRFVVVAVVEEAGFGSTVAAPIVRRVLEVLTGVAPAPPDPPAVTRPTVPGIALPTGPAASRAAGWSGTIPVLIGSVLALASLGVVLVGAATRRHGPTFAVRQLSWVALGIAVLVAATMVDLDALRRRANLLYGAGLAGLVLVLSPLGAATNGAQAWFSLGPLALQPAEVMKPLLVLALAAHGARAGGPLDGRRLLGALLLLALPVGLVLLQPDLGTTMVLVFLAAGVVAVAGARARHLALLAVLGVVAVAGVLRAGVLAPYQVERLTGFLHQSADPRGASWNLEQAKIAIGSGGHRRGGPVLREPDPVGLRARAAHRLRLHGGGGGVGPARRGHGPGALRPAGLAGSGGPPGSRPTPSGRCAAPGSWPCWSSRSPRTSA